MCGRFAVIVDLERLLLRFDVKADGDFVLPRYNIAPMQQVPVILDSKPKTLSQIRWGLTPSWSKEDSGIINARGETFAEKPSFKRAKRCLIPASGFYEWQKTPAGKMAYWFYTDDLFSFAGLWDNWVGPSGEIQSFTIITVEPNSVVSKIHNRMPAILSRADEARWLAGDDDLLHSYAGEMHMYPVSTMVNSTLNEGSELIKQIGQQILL